MPMVAVAAAAASSAGNALGQTLSRCTHPTSSARIRCPAFAPARRFQGVHEPRQAPAHYVDMYNDTITDPGRRSFAGMLSAVDEGTGASTQRAI